MSSQYPFPSQTNLSDKDARNLPFMPAYTTPDEDSTSSCQDPDQRTSSQSIRSSGAQRSSIPEIHLLHEPQSRPSLSQSVRPQPSKDQPHQLENKGPTRNVTITIDLPSVHKEDDGTFQPGAASFQTDAKPEDIHRLLGIPEFQPRDPHLTYASPRNYNYEEKYPADEPFKENDPDARFFKVYLDEAEIFDQEKIRSHRDSLDSLLVFAALFSAVVTTLVVQTSDTLQPNQGLITNYLLLHQIEILKAMGNATAIARIAPSQYLPDTKTHSRSDVWVNGLFFMSLALSLSTAMLSVLAKQWLQAYDSTTSGSARDRALVRQLRFMGLRKWKLDEIIGALPLVLHLSVAVFLIGLSVFLWALYPSLAWIIIAVCAASFALYLASIVLPAIDIECPYRIPLLYLPMRYIVLALSGSFGKLKTAVNQLWLSFVKPSSVPLVLKGVWLQIHSALSVLMGIVRWSGRLILQILPNPTLVATFPSSIKDAERSAVRGNENSRWYLHHSISWLHQMSSNTTVQRIATQAIAGKLCTPSPYGDLPLSFRALYIPRTQALFEGQDLTSYNPSSWLRDQWVHSPSPWVRALGNLTRLSSRLPHVGPSIKERLMLDMGKAAEMGRSEHLRFILDLAEIDHAHVNKRLPTPRWSAGTTPLYAASYNGHHNAIRLLLERGANVNPESSAYGSPLQAASNRGHVEAVKVLLEKGAEVNWEGDHWGPAIQAASCHGHLEIVKALLDSGAEVNAIGGRAGSALETASFGGHLNIVQLLLESGADVNLEAGVYGSALQAASYRGNLDIVHVLLEKGADINLGGGIQGSALQAASYHGHSDVVKLLLHHGANVNLRGGIHGTSLLAACYGGHLDIVKLLLEMGADITPKSELGRSGLQVAIWRGCAEVAELLRNHGAVE